MVAYTVENTGRFDFIALKDQYEAVGVHVENSDRDNKVFNHLFYSGEKKPNMWWDEFESHLINAFSTYDCLEKRIIIQIVRGFTTSNQSICQIGVSPDTGINII